MKDVQTPKAGDSTTDDTSPTRKTRRHPKRSATSPQKFEDNTLPAMNAADSYPA